METKNLFTMETYTIFSIRLEYLHLLNDDIVLFINIIFFSSR